MVLKQPDCEFSYFCLFYLLAFSEKKLYIIWKKKTQIFSISLFFTLGIKKCWTDPYFYIFRLRMNLVIKKESKLQVVGDRNDIF